MNFEQASNFPVNEMVIETVSDSDLFGDIEGSPSNDVITPQPQGNQVNGLPNEGNSFNVGSVLPANVIINGIDMILPPLAVMGLRACGYTFQAKDLKLTANEKKSLEKPVQDYANTVNLKLSPLEGLIIAFGCVYAGKLLPVLLEGKPAKKSKETTEDLNEKNEGAGTKRKERSDKGIKR